MAKKGWKTRRKQRQTIHDRVHAREDSAAALRPIKVTIKGVETWMTKAEYRQIVASQPRPPAPAPKRGKKHRKVKARETATHATSPRLYGSAGTNVLPPAPFDAATRPPWE
jgi:hypothetical protein